MKIFKPIGNLFYLPLAVLVMVSSALAQFPGEQDQTRYENRLCREIQKTYDFQSVKASFLALAGQRAGDSQRPMSVNTICSAFFEDGTVHKDWFFTDWSTDGRGNVIQTNINAGPYSGSFPYSANSHPTQTVRYVPSQSPNVFSIRRDGFNILIEEAAATSGQRNSSGFGQFYEPGNPGNNPATPFLYSYRGIHYWVCRPRIQLPPQF